VFVLDSGDGEVQPHPDAPEAGYANAQSIEKYGTSIFWYYVYLPGWGV